jgi:hypothetical protein
MIPKSGGRCFQGKSEFPSATKNCRTRDFYQYIPGGGGFKKMGYIRGRISERDAGFSTARSRKFVAANFAAFGLLFVFGAVYLAGCGNGGSNIPKSKSYTPHDTINLKGETAQESYLKISSTVEGEAAVSVTNGGRLILKDATIWKIGDEASGSPTYGIAGMGGDQPPETGNPPPPPDAGAPPPPSEGRALQDPPPPPREDMPAGDQIPEGEDAEKTSPGPGATHAGVFAGSGGGISLENVSVETAIGEGSGLYASGKGSAITLVNGTITTDGSTAHGVFVTHEGTVEVENVTIITKGEHSSALATFRGGGTVTAVGGTYTAFGKYSAGIYSAGHIMVEDVVCKSVSDHAAVVEGGSRITLKDSVLWSREKGGVMMYQSFSGDAPEGPSCFEMTGGGISADDGPIFYVTNTTGSILLNQVDLHNPSGILMKVLMGAWDVDIAWSKPVQGGTVTLVAENQVLTGDIVVDEFSTLDATLKNGSMFTGGINSDDHGQDVRLILDDSSTWQVTSDSYLSGLTFTGGIPAAGITNIVGNGYTVFYGKDASPALGGETYDLPNGGKLMPK